VALLYAIVVMTALLAICSLGIDYGRVQLAKAELERAADAAARAGANVLPTSGAAVARTTAITYGGYHRVDDSALSLSAADVEIGNYTGTTFTVNGSPSNAIRVTAARTTAKGNPVNLTFGPLIGIGNCDIRAVCIATGTQRSPTGLVGLNSITLKNNAFIGSYNSSTTTNRAPARRCPTPP